MVSAPRARFPYVVTENITDQGAAAFADRLVKQRSDFSEELFGVRVEHRPWYGGGTLVDHADDSCTIIGGSGPPVIERPHPILPRYAYEFGFNEGMKSREHRPLHARGRFISFNLGRRSRFPPERSVEELRDRLRQSRDKIGNRFQVLVFTSVNVENDTAVERLDFRPMSFADVARACKENRVPAGVEFRGRSLDRQDKSSRIVDGADLGYLRGDDGTFAELDQFQHLADRSALFFCERTVEKSEHEAAPVCLGAQLAISVNNCPPPRDPRSRMTSFKRTQRKYVQKAYRVRNWREYETGLRARGSLTVWLGLTDGKLAHWNSPRPTRRKPGRQRQYSNHAIETTVTLGLVFGLASRQTEGFLRSLLTLLNLDNDVPDHSTISRRKARLGKVASYERRTVKPVHLLIDSSGLSVHVGQWRTPPKARDSRKLHLAVDEQTSDVVACELTSSRRFPGGVTRRPDRASHRLGQGRRRVRHRRRL